MAGKLGINQEMLRRAVNVGFSGGEKKRNEILQMALFEPRLAVLDETDSGLVIDALKIVSDGVNRLRAPTRSAIVITHYQRLLNYIVPDVVHVLSRGRIVKTGGKDLALELEARGESEYSTPDFLKKVREVAKSLNIPQDMLRRGVNVGFSGGEKKRNEILQMALFQPSLCILDEMDSGLDIDALRVAADGVNALRSPDRAMVVITHYQRLLNYIVPDFVHVMSKGRVVKSGGKDLALELEASGYAQFEDAA